MLLELILSKSNSVFLQWSMTLSRLKQLANCIVVFRILCSIGRIVSSKKSNWIAGLYSQTSQFLQRTEISYYLLEKIYTAKTCYLYFFFQKNLSPQQIIFFLLCFSYWIRINYKCRTSSLGCLTFNTIVCQLLLIF